MEIKTVILEVDGYIDGEVDDYDIITWSKWNFARSFPPLKDMALCLQDHIKELGHEMKEWKKWHDVEKQSMHLRLIWHGYEIWS